MDKARFILVSSLYGVYSTVTHTTLSIRRTWLLILSNLFVKSSKKSYEVENMDILFHIASYYSVISNNLFKIVNHSFTNKLISIQTLIAVLLLIYCMRFVSQLNLVVSGRNLA